MPKRLYILMLLVMLKHVLIRSEAGDNFSIPPLSATHTHTYIHTHTYMHMCTYIHTYIHTHTCTYIHAHLYIHKYIHTCTRTTRVHRYV